MEGIERITEAILREAGEEADRIAENCKKDIIEIEKLYEKEARVSESNILRAAEKKANEIRQRSISGARIEARKGPFPGREQAGGFG